MPKTNGPTDPVELVPALDDSSTKLREFVNAHPDPANSPEELALLKKVHDRVVAKPSGGWSPPPDPKTREDWVALRTADKVCIVGYAPTCRLAPKGDADMDFWGMNDLYANPTMAGTDWTMWFDLHDPTVMQQNPRTKENHWKWLCKKRGMPILTLHKEPEIPDSVGYPLDLVKELAWDGKGYFTATPSYMVALAILMGYKEIQVYGINLMGDEEYAYQRPCFEYWCGVAQGLGIKLVIPEGATILRSSFLYGYETHGYEGDELIRHIKQKLQQHVERHKQLEATIHENNGSIQALKYLLTVTRGFLNGTITPDRDVASKLNPQFGPEGARDAFLGHVAEQKPPSRDEIQAQQAEIQKHVAALQALGVTLNPV